MQIQSVDIQRTYNRSFGGNLNLKNTCLRTILQGAAEDLVQISPENNLPSEAKRDLAIRAFGKLVNALGLEQGKNTALVKGSAGSLVPIANARLYPNKKISATTERYLTSKALEQIQATLQSLA